MKKLILMVMAVVLSSLTWAQNRQDSTASNRGRLQVSAFGGLSMPLGKYKNEIGRAKNGYFAGLAIDQYFKGNKWGIGLDARFLNHEMRKLDSVFFANGHIATAYKNHPSFQHIALSVGPTYKVGFGKLDFEAFLRGGVLFEGFPQYTQSIYVNAASGPPVKTFDNYYTSNSKEKTKSWMGLGGLRLSYGLGDHLALFVQADYLRAFGKSFGSDSSEFYITRYSEKKAITATDVMNVKIGQITNILDFYEEKPVTQKTFVQAVNVGLGIKYTFGGKRKIAAPVPVTKTLAPPASAVPKDILVVVKDRQTGLALSGVTLKISHKGVDHTSISNAEGQAERIKGAEKGSYQVTAVKNGIAAEPVAITASDFDKAGNVIYKEIYHDDPRFTLIGETVRANDNAKLPGIGTVLTNASNSTNMTQISDAEAKFVYQLEQQSDYNIVANQAGKFSQTESVSTKGLDRSKTLYVTLKLGVSNLDAGAVFVLKNIHYDFDKSNIRPDAGRILDNLLNVMSQNPTLKIELSSHTDSRGKDTYNLRLSQQRAEAAVNYLVGKGVARDRMVAKGYGETRLLNRCANGIICTEDEHQENRRTEIKVLKF
ncbi:outer membrane protein OmpA-like peptidoglycan-associated protein [Pedobacter sp. AK017]|uniref:OmpA family protein n=1 Tax=Pedobacter sp. AK017 TaxID=2723073 RepID=UPI00161AB1A8|nr:OmpA family protein [Pedobacter sp. AK017]MBB5437164.1 outer membrane protein OmpA-like peptidoglycan-associated protein [Pedobacter sp. AK017]